MRTSFARMLLALSATHQRDDMSARVACDLASEEPDAAARAGDENFAPRDRPVAFESV
jgi:hypothetical protein